MSNRNTTRLWALGLAGISLAVCLALLPEKKPVKKQSTVGNLPVLWESLPENAKRYRVSRPAPTTVENTPVPLPETPAPTPAPTPRPTETPSPTPTELPDPTPVPTPDMAPRAERSSLDFLLLCTEDAQRPGSATAGTMAVLSLDFTRSTARLLRLNPDLSVPTQAGPKALGQLFDPANPRAFQALLQRHLGLETDHYALAGPEALELAVDALGGVEIILTDREAALLGDRYRAGTTALDGSAAADYLLLSDASCNSSRALREQTLIRALLRSARDAKLAELTRLYRAVSPAASTDLHRGELLRLLLRAPELLEMHLELSGLPDTDPAGAADAAREFLYGSPAA